MVSLLDVYERAPERVQSVLRTGYYGVRSAESQLASRLIDTRAVPTVDRRGLRSHPEVSYWSYDDGETHQFDPPSVPGHEDVIEQGLRRRVEWRADICEWTGSPASGYSVRCHEPFVSECPKVVLFGPHALPKTARGELLTEAKAGIRGGGGSFDVMFLSTLREFGWLRTAVAMRQDTTDTEYDYEVATSLLSGRIGSVPAYGHWLVEILPRLRGIEHYRRQTGRTPTVLVNPEISEWQLEMLRLVGVDEKRVQPWNGGRASVRHYVLPMWAKSEWSASNIEWIRSRIELAVDYERHLDKSPSRVFLSRELTDKRRVSNRSELLTSLDGFESYTPETLSFAEQVALFKSADIILGPTGSSLTNMIFSSDATVVELFPAEYFLSWFFELASVVGLDYRLVFAGDVDPESHDDPHNRDFSVSPERVRAAIDR